MLEKYKLLLQFIIIFVLPSEILASNESSKIAVLDIQVIWDSSKAMNHIRNESERLSNILQKKFQDKEIFLKKEEKRLLGIKDSVSIQEFEKNQNNFRKQVNIAQKSAREEKTKLEKANSNAMLRLNQETLKITSEIASKRGYSIVLSTSNILYAEEKINITQEVLEILDEKLPIVELEFES